MFQNSGGAREFRRGLVRKLRQTVAHIDQLFGLWLIPCPGKGRPVFSLAVHGELSVWLFFTKSGTVSKKERLTSLTLTLKTASKGILSHL